MDEAWLWGILSGIAILLSGSLATLAQQKIDTSPIWGWYCLVLAPLPLAVWNVAWVIMTQPSDSIRRPISIVVGAIAGAVIFLGVTELLSKRVHAQPALLPEHKEILMTDNTGPTFNVPGSGNIVTNNQSGGSNTLNVYRGEQLATVGEETKAKIREMIPSGSSIMIIKMVNDGPSAQMEQIFKDLLVSMGYKIEGSGIGFGGRYFKGYSVGGKGANGVYTLTIGDPRSD